jgi:hypothetical protein
MRQQWKQRIGRPRLGAFVEERIVGRDDDGRHRKLDQR